MGRKTKIALLKARDQPKSLRSGFFTARSDVLLLFPRRRRDVLLEGKAIKTVWYQVVTASRPSQDHTKDKGHERSFLRFRILWSTKSVRRGDDEKADLAGSPTILVRRMMLTLLEYSRYRASTPRIVLPVTPKQKAYHQGATILRYKKRGPCLVSSPLHETPSRRSRLTLAVDLFKVVFSASFKFFRDVSSIQNHTCRAKRFSSIARRMHESQHR